MPTTKTQLEHRLARIAEIMEAAPGAVLDHTGKVTYEGQLSPFDLAEIYYLAAPFLPRTMNGK